MRRGQSLVEATIVLLVFFALLVGVIDCGQVIYSHQVLQERVRSAVRYGSLHRFDPNGDQIADLILYDQLTDPNGAKSPFLGLSRENIQVRYQPDQSLLTVAIVNYQSHFFSPWITRPVIDPRPVMITSPVSYSAR